MNKGFGIEAEFERVCIEKSILLKAIKTATPNIGNLIIITNIREIYVSFHTVHFPDSII